VTTATITARPYAGEADLARIADLQNACEAIDRLDMGTSLDELRTELGDPRLDTARDLRLWQDDDGQVIGFGQLWVLQGTADLNGRLMLWVRPQARDQGLETQIIAWATERLRQAAQEHGKPARLRIQVREGQDDRLAFLRAQGFTIDRYSFTMTRSLDAPIAEPRLPAGFVIREVAGPHEAEQWAEMFNLSFIDHPGSSPWAAQQVLHYLSEPNYRQDLNLVAIAPDGTFAGFCWAVIYPEQNARSGRSEGEIDVLGTRRGFRKIGLGRALLLEGLRRIKAAGMASAGLGVIANNPTGALQLYESVGFQRVHTWILHGKDV
jgi:mycothiol synthase